MKVYELKLKKGGKGVFKVSVVKDPAIESTLLKFAKEKEEILTFADEEKRIIYSVAMRPNKMIFRKDVNGEPANIFYTKETVEEAQINYFRNNGNKSTNIDHADEDVKGVFPFESWVVQDPEIDKSKLLGMTTFAGDLVMGYKIDNPEIWKEIKEDKLDGLSIEAINLEHILKEDIKMKKNEKSFVEKIVEMAQEFLKPVNSNNEDIVEFSKDDKKYVVDDLKVGSIVKDAEGNLASKLSFVVSGLKFVTDEDGAISDEEKKKDMALHPKKDEDEDKEKQSDHEDGDDEDDEEPTEKEKALMDEIISLKQTIADLEAEKIKDDENLETMKSEMVDLKKKKPAAKKIPKGPKTEMSEDQKPYEKMTNYEKLKFNREN